MAACNVMKCIPPTLLDTLWFCFQCFFKAQSLYRFPRFPVLSFPLLPVIRVGSVHGVSKNHNDLRDRLKSSYFLRTTGRVQVSSSGFACPDLFRNPCEKIQIFFHVLYSCCWMPLTKEIGFFKLGHEYGGMLYEIAIQRSGSRLSSTH